MKTKYPRTPHLPYSLGTTSDDKMLDNVDHFIGKEVVWLEKRDGENTNMYSDLIHARSIDSADHESRHWVKMLHSTIKRDIPNDMRICGENLFAKHSIYYENLESYFEVFQIWQGATSLSWDDTVEWCELLGLIHVPVLYRGIFDESVHKKILNSMDLSKQEGYVVRLVESFRVEDFVMSVAKWVRHNHVQTDEHWMLSKIIQNKIAKS